jgi:hypothetical protein
MNKDTCLLSGGMSPARSARHCAGRERIPVQTRVRRRRRAGPGARRLPSRATPLFHYLAA